MPRELLGIVALLHTTKVYEQQQEISQRFPQSRSCRVRNTPSSRYRLLVSRAKLTLFVALKEADFPGPCMDLVVRDTAKLQLPDPQSFPHPHRRR